MANKTDTVAAAGKEEIFITREFDAPREIVFGAFSLLDKYAAAVPRVALRYAVERLDKKQRDYYLSMKKVG